MKNKVIIVSGDVRNKGYRFTAMQKAYQFDIRGYIKRVHEGGFFIEAEGEDENLTQFIEWCKKGPIGSKVEKVEVTDGEMKSFKSFDMR